MGMDKYYEAVKFIKKNQHLADFEHPISEELILKAENKLQITFPKSYRQFIKDFGCGDFAGEEFFGIVNDEFDDSSIPNGIWLTLKKRQADNLPKYLILVAETGDGDYYAIDTSTVDNNGESPVVIWEGEPKVKYEIVSNDFSSFFCDKVLNAIS